MNNSRFAIENVPLTLEEPVSNEVQLRERETQVVRIIAALQGIQKGKDWSSLKNELFDGITDRLSKDILSEAKKPTPDTNKLNRLTGELRWAERYSDLPKLEQEFKAELAVIKQKLHGTT